MSEAKLPVGATGSSGKEICRAFRNNGKCRFEKDCKYEHSQGPAVDAPPRDYTPKGDCHNWEESKECHFGDRCRFLHGAEDKRTTYRVQRAENTSGEQEICRIYQKRGKCRFGDKCKHKHVAPEKKAGGEKKDAGNGNGTGGGRRRGAARRGRGGPAQHDKDGKEICRKNQAGRCKFGADCQYSHAAGVATAGGNAGGNKSAAPKTERKAREPKDCAQFGEGKCEWGDDCRYKHGPNDKRDLSQRKRRVRGGKEPGVCYNFEEKGSCEFGSSCRFKHEKPAA